MVKSQGSKRSRSDGTPPCVELGYLRNDSIRLYQYPFLGIQGQDLEVMPTWNDTRLSRLITREGGETGKVNIDYAYKRGRAFYVYLQLIDLTWSSLFLLFIGSYLTLNLTLALLFFCDESGINDANEDDSITKFERAFFFSVQTMDTIGYGALSPKGRYVNWCVVLASMAANFYWAIWTGIIFLRVARPSYIKYSFRFSDYACINHFESVYDGDHDDVNGKYVKGYRSLSLRLADQRPNAVVCDGKFTLLYFHWQHVEGTDEYEFITHEMDFEINRQLGRNRSMGFSAPVLSIPWKVVHKIDETSPLWQKSIEAIKAERGEIIALLDGIDENTSENYQARWSYCGEEIKENQRFVQCLVYAKRSGRNRLVCDLGLLSMTMACGPALFDFHQDNIPEPESKSRRMSPKRLMTYVKEKVSPRYSQRNTIKQNLRRELQNEEIIKNFEKIGDEEFNKSEPSSNNLCESDELRKYPCGSMVTSRITSNSKESYESVRTLN